MDCSQHDSSVSDVLHETVDKVSERSKIFRKCLYNLCCMSASHHNVHILHIKDGKRNNKVHKCLKKTTNLSKQGTPDKLNQCHVCFSPNINHSSLIPTSNFHMRVCMNWSIFWDILLTDRQMERREKHITSKVISPVKPRVHLQVYCGGDDGRLVEIHVAPFKQLLGFIRQASPTYWQNSPSHPGAQTHCRKTEQYLYEQSSEWTFQPIPVNNPGTLRCCLCYVLEKHCFYPSTMNFKKIR